MLKRGAWLALLLFGFSSFARLNCVSSAPKGDQGTEATVIQSQCNLSAQGDQGRSGNGGELLAIILAGQPEGDTNLGDEKGTIQ